MIDADTTEAEGGEPAGAVIGAAAGAAGGGAAGVEEATA
jgi:hypothetical protein